MEQTPDPYLSLWNLELLEQVGDTVRGRVYKVCRGEEFYALKIFIQAGNDEHRYGLSFLEHCNGTASCRLIAKEGNAALLEYADGISLGVWADEGRDEETVRIMAELLNAVHALKSSKGDFLPLEKRLEDVLKFKNSREAPAFLQRGAEIAQDLLAHQENVCLLHGDMHPDNVMHHSIRGWLSIDPKGVIGDRAYDCANILLSPYRMKTIYDRERIIRTAHILGSETGLDPKKILRYGFVYACEWGGWEFNKLCGGDHGTIMAETIEPMLDEKI